MEKNQKLEKEFLKEYDPSKWERPGFTVDMLIFSIRNIKEPVLRILLMKRQNLPFLNYWALPGGFVDMKDSLDEAAKKKLKEKTGLENIYLEQLYTFGDVNRDPRTRIITSAYMALVPENSITIKQDNLKWFDVYFTDSELKLKNEDTCISYEIEKTAVKNGVITSNTFKLTLKDESNDELAFDHSNIIYMAINRIAGKCEYIPVLYNLMPEEFTMTELQSVYELFLMKRPHNTQFRNRNLRHLIDTGKVDKTSFRPAKIYSINMESF